MPRIVVVDTYYDAFLKTLTLGNSTYQEELDKVLSMQFGTSDFYSRNLRALGWEAIDIIANYQPMQELWLKQKLGKRWTGTGAYIAGMQIDDMDADVVFLQDLSLLRTADLAGLYRHRFIAAQCSCPWPGDDVVSQCNVIFTSFPHYVPRIEKLGVRAVYNPLAFEPSVLNDRLPLPRTEPRDAVDYYRPHDVVFIGGVGNPSHWKAGMQVLEAVAREIPTFKWWGYGAETLPKDSALRPKYQGQAWGREMYDILLRSKICLNRHGEVAEGYANNMRMYEATGCGALLLTEDAPNLLDFFSEDECEFYITPSDAVHQIKTYLDLVNPWVLKSVATEGQNRTLRDHTYAKRMQVVSDVLKEALVSA